MASLLRWSRFRNAVPDGVHLQRLRGAFRMITESALRQPEFHLPELLYILPPPCRSICGRDAAVGGEAELVATSATGRNQEADAALSLTLPQDWRRNFRDTTSALLHLLRAAAGYPAPALTSSSIMRRPSRRAKASGGKWISWRRLRLMQASCRMLPMKMINLSERRGGTGRGRGS